MSAPGGSRPPRLAQALLSACLPRGGYAESVLGDLEEVYGRRVAEDGGRWRATLWYWTTACRVGSGYLVRRLLRRRRHRPLPGSLPRAGERVGVHGARGTATLGDLVEDVRFAIRGYRRSPGFLAVALLTLALGIGGTTAIFSVVRAVYLEPLPFEAPHELVRVGLYALERPGGLAVHTAGDFQDWRREAGSFQAMAAWGYRTVTVERGHGAERVQAAISVGSLFDVLGREAGVGRTFSTAEEGPGAENLVVLSHRYADGRLGGEEVVGSTLRIDGTPHTVLGVMPEDFAYPRGADLWMTAALDAEELSARNNFFLRTVARLGDGVAVDRARREMEELAERARERHPDTFGGLGIAVEPMGAWLRAGAGDRWWILMAGVTLVLLIGCANLANLLLGRGTNRRGEFAVRRALGAGEGRLLRQSLTESVVLALLGGVLGVATASILLELLVRWMPGGVPRAESVGLDPAVLLFALAVSLGTGALFGLLPAVQVRREAVGSSLPGRGGSGPASRVLVAGEVAMAVILLAAAGLTLRSWVALSGEAPGIATAELATFQVALPGRDAEDRHLFHRRLEARLEALPGVRSVGAVSTRPVTDFTPGAWINEPGASREAGDRPVARYQIVSPGYFETAGVELREGRLLTRDDGVDGTRAVVVSETAARELFPGEEALGKRFDMGLDGDIAPLSTVVGVVGDVKLDRLDEPAPAAVYAVQELVPWWEGYHVLLRLEPGAAIPSGIRELVRSVDPTVAALDVHRYRDLLVGSLEGRRNLVLLFGLLGGVAVVMAAVGVFGVVAFWVGRQRREIGVRMAVGAGRASVQRHVLRRGLAPVGAGLAVGLAGAAALGGVMESLIFGVRPVDLPTLAAVAGLLTAVSALAIWVPARRAARVDPVSVLNGE